MKACAGTLSRRVGSMGSPKRTFVGHCSDASVSDGSSVADLDEVERPSFLSIGVDRFPGRKVENGPDAVREKLFCALAERTMTRDARTPCRALLDVLSALDQPN
jgi:hypothetical protein